MRGKAPSIPRDNYTIHHNFTTKTPRESTIVSEHPLKKTPINPHNSLRTSAREKNSHKQV